ncbi:hypothetical protein P3S67_007955 [Capsicum chacoense]
MKMELFRLCIILFISFAMMINPSSSTSSSLYNNFRSQYKNFDQISSIHRATSSSSMRKCNGGLVGNCIEDEEEMMMESDITRRVLQGQGRYISYGAMAKNNIPCNTRGASYYNCHANKRVNPYRRGCTKITRCARSNS